MEPAEFESPTGERSQYEPALVVDVAGFEGPLDLLLTLARNQQVDHRSLTRAAFSTLIRVRSTAALSAWPPR